MVCIGIKSRLINVIVGDEPLASGPTTRWTWFNLDNMEAVNTLEEFLDVRLRLGRLKKGDVRLSLGVYKEEQHGHH